MCFELLHGSLNFQEMLSEDRDWDVKLELRRVLSLSVCLIDIVISDVSHHISCPFPSPTTTSVFVLTALAVVVPVAGVHRQLTALDV